MPARLALDLTDHEVSTVAREGWAGAKNGALLSLAESAMKRAREAGTNAIEFMEKTLCLGSDSGRESICTFRDSAT